MADSHEEQLLSDLLSGIAREDAALDGAHLETRVVESAFARAPSILDIRHSYAKAAAVVVAMLVPAIVWRASMPASEMVRLKPDTLEIAAAPSVAIDASTRQTPTLPTSETRPTPTTRPTLTTPSVPESSDEFIPLVPIAEQELTGSFQIVRVQMPRGSLGRLRSPLERPDELVEADVLLGADGMARAIRVSTASSIYARRSR